MFTGGIQSFDSTQTEAGVWTHELHTLGIRGHGGTKPGHYKDADDHGYRPSNPTSHTALHFPVMTDIKDSSGPWLNRFIHSQANTDSSAQDAMPVRTTANAPQRAKSSNP